jgi:hypothetical protein
MPKPRFTIPISHADDVPTIAFTDEQWQAIEHAYQQLNADVRQQITTVTTQYLKDCIFERTAAPKAMAWKRIERIRRAAGDLAKVLDSKPFSAPTDEVSRGQQEQQQSVHSYTDHLIRRHFNDPRLVAGWRGDHFQGVLTSLVVACDYALNDLSAAEGSGDGQAWDWWILYFMLKQHKIMPLLSNVMEAGGLGPLSIFWTAPPAAPVTFWLLVTAVGLILGVLFVFVVFATTLDVGIFLGKYNQQERQLTLIGLSLFLVSFFPLPFLGLGVFGFYDRYLIVLIAPLLLLFVIGCGLRDYSAQSNQSVVAWGMVALMGCFAVAATHDYLAWSRARWTAL